MSGLDTNLGEGKSLYILACLVVDNIGHKKINDVSISLQI